jgi:hypothetical protein
MKTGCLGEYLDRKGLSGGRVEDEMGGECSTNVEKRNACILLVGKPVGKRQLGKPRRNWVNNIKMNL